MASKYHKIPYSYWKQRNKFYVVKNILKLFCIKNDFAK